MADVKVYQIAQVFLKEEGYVKTEEIAEILGISTKTVHNHMDQVCSFFGQHGMNLRRVRGTGSILEGSPVDRLKLYAYVTDKRKTTPEASSLERQFYILHLLLNTNKRVSAANISETLYVSRATIYNDLNDLTEWLFIRDIELKTSRREGLMLVCGEKRRRIAIVDWYTQLRDYLKKYHIDQAENGHTGPVDLTEILFYYDQFIERETVNTIVTEIEQILDVKFVPDEFRRFCILLYITLPRIRSGTYASMSEERMAELQKSDEKGIGHKIGRLIEQHYPVKLTEEEIWYFYGVLLMGRTHENSTSMEFDETYIKRIVSKLTRAVYKKYRIAGREQFEAECRRHIGGVVNRIRLSSDFHNPAAGQIKEQFPELFRIASVVVPAMKYYYNYVLPDEELAYLTLHMAAAIEASKQPLKTAVIYEGCYNEARFMLEVIRKKIPCVDIIWVGPVPLNSELEYPEETEIIITNTDEEMEFQLPVVRCTALLFGEESRQAANILTDYYEQINMKRIRNGGNI